MIKWDVVLSKCREHVVTKIFGYVLLALGFYVLGGIDVGFDDLHPLGVALLFPVVTNNVNPLISNLLFLFFNSLAGFSLKSLYISLNVVVVCYLACVVHKKLKKDMSWLKYIYALLSFATYISLNLTSSKHCLATILSIALTLLVMACADVFLNATIVRGFNTRLNLDEMICGGVLLVVVSLGVAKLHFGHWEMIKIFAPFVILVSTYVFSASTTIVTALLMGVGYALYNLDLILVSVFVLFALISLAFKSTYKILSPIAMILAEVAFGLYFKVYVYFGYQNLVCVGIAGLLFMLCPRVMLQTIKDMLGGAREKLAIRNIVNRTKDGICRRMNEVGEIFNEMDNVFRDMVKGTLSEDDAKEMIISDLSEKVCKTCPNYAKCMRVSSEYTHKVLGGMVETGIEKGKCTLIDVPQYLSSKCGRLNVMLANLNNMLKSYKTYNNMVSNMDASRMLIADQLGGISTLLKKLGEEVKLNITFDTHEESLICEELSYKNIICVEALVYEESVGQKKVELILKGGCEMADVEKIVSKVCHQNMSVSMCTSASVPDCSAITLLPRPNFDIVFGSSSCSKKGIFKNGDVHSLIKINHGRYMIALCDGMGSGEKAKKLSSLTVTLIENFYKAGFDNDTILSSVNKLLCLNSQENFTAVDLCVLDLNQNTADYIKLGATYGLVKNQQNIDIIESSGLPIGVLEEIRPHITKRMITAWDNIILLSDGVSDAFGSIENLEDFILSQNTLNPQELSEQIIDRAVDINGGVIKDDMTVLVARIFPL